MKFPTRYPNLNALWSSLILEELWRLGVRDCCLAPGSRSAPLTLVVAAHKGLKKHIHFDERGLGFFALGLAKQSRRPVAVITTSGTAVANLYPAIIEASLSNVPLIIVTADRPPELIDCGANQAIDQLGIYADYPAATINFPTPSQEIPASWVLTSVDQAFAQSCLQGLPMHINCMFREPLYPGEKSQNYSELLQSCGDWLCTDQPYTSYHTSVNKPDLNNDIYWQDFFQEKGIIVVGRVDASVELEPVLELAKRVGWPVITDIQSQLHGHQSVIQLPDLLLANKRGKTLLSQIDRVFHIGAYLVSKRLNRFLEKKNWQHYVMLGEECRRTDAGHRQTHRIVGPIDVTCDALIKLLSVNNKLLSKDPEPTVFQERDWLAELSSISETISAAVLQKLECENALTEAWIGATLSAYLPHDVGVFLGNSLSIRLMDTYSSTHTCNVFTNRGASGIDGLLATASGCATAMAKPFLVLLGDLSFLHDLNSLALTKRVSHPLVIVLLNNDGGGIFKLLPLTEVADKAETYFQTPHGLEASGAAAMFWYYLSCTNMP